MVKQSTILMVASMQNDVEVRDLCAIAATDKGRRSFDSVVVVDSTGSGRFRETIKLDGLHDFVSYDNSPHNLGAAGNLLRRLEISSELNADWVFALNHDGKLDLDVVERLIAVASKNPDVGAVYPLMTLPDGRFDLTYTLPFPWRAKRADSKPKERLLPVYWGSSNGALFSLSPYRNGARPFVEIWHGWEDFAYGLEIKTYGFPQVMVTDATLDSGYDYQSRRLMGKSWLTSCKAPWLAYYFSRNLILIKHRYGEPRLRFLGARILREVLAVLVLRDHKYDRLRFLARGIRDGIRGCTGMTVKPSTECS